MKRIYITILLTFMLLFSAAQTVEYLQKKDFQAEKSKIYENINAIKKVSPELLKLMNIQHVRVDSLSAVVSMISDRNTTYLDTLNRMALRVNGLENSLIRFHDKTKMNFIYILIMAGVILFLILAYILVLRKQIELQKNRMDVMGGDIKKSGDDLLRAQMELKDMNARIKSGLEQMESKYLELRQIMRDNVSSLDEKIIDSGKKNETDWMKVRSEMEHICAEYRQQNKTLNEKISELTDRTSEHLNEVKSQMNTEIKELVSEILKGKNS